MRFEDPIYGESKVLNQNGFHSTAAIAVSIDSYFDGDITISDCNRAIGLSISLNGRRSAENSIKKVEILIDVLTKYKDVLCKLKKEIEESGYYDIEEDDYSYKSREVMNKIISNFEATS